MAGPHTSRGACRDRVTGERGTMDEFEVFAAHMHILLRATDRDLTYPQLCEHLIDQGYRIRRHRVLDIVEELSGKGLLASADDGPHRPCVYRTTPAGTMALAYHKRALSTLAHDIFGDTVPAAPPARRRGYRRL